MHLQINDLLCKLMGWFLYGRDLRHKKVKCRKMLIRLDNLIASKIIFPIRYLAARREFNTLTINVPQHIETSQLLCSANQLIGFYMMGTMG